MIRLKDMEEPPSSITKMMVSNRLNPVSICSNVLIKPEITRAPKTAIRKEPEPRKIVLLDRTSPYSPRTANGMVTPETSQH